MAKLSALTRTVGVESLGLEFQWLLAVAWLWRFKATTQIRGGTRLHLGCGPHVLPGWVNLDLAGAPGTVRWNLGWRLPADDASIDLVFSEHFIEHIDKADAARLLKDCQRALKVGGVLRISTPSLEELLSAYRSCRLDGWSDVNWRPATLCDLINEGMRSWGHRYVYDEPELRRQLESAGFSEVRRVPWRESSVPALSGLERRPYHGELILEAIK